MMTQKALTKRTSTKPAATASMSPINECSSQAAITVSDTGVGINKELLPHVFDYCRRGNDASTARCEGLGLGLAIVREIVTQHGGTVDAQSPGEGQGATFLVLLPLCDCDSEVQRG